MQKTENSIKLTPTDPSLRWLLFQLLCFLGDWQRALKQLQLCAQMQPELERDAQVYRGLIRCELFRQECFTGARRPGFVMPPPQWTDTLLNAIGHNQRGEEEQADTDREAALNATVDVAGSSTPGGSFEWISDSDTWLGPTIEVVIGGTYTWLPFSQLRQITSTPPKNALDLIWKPTQLTLADGSVHSGFLLTRYCGSETASDSVRLGRETIWREHGRTSIRAQGQKTWQTDQGDLGLLDITACTFYVPQSEETAAHG